jgi:hypothetical protein
MSTTASIHEHHDSRPNTTVAHDPDGAVLGYIERVVLSSPQRRYASSGGVISKGWQPQGVGHQPLTDYAETHERALEWVAEQ